MDLRTSRTISAIENSFIELASKIGFKKVTVLKIADKAQINPKTFYDHFHDKYDLAQKLTNEFLGQYRQLIQNRLDYSKAQNNDLNNNIKELLYSLIKDKKTRQLLLMLENIDEINFDKQLEKLIATQLSNRHIAEEQLTVNIIASIVTTMINYYIRNNDQFSVKHQYKVLGQLDHMLNTLILNHYKK